jgi:hypothetical protein
MGISGRGSKLYYVSIYRQHSSGPIHTPDGADETQLVNL